MRDARVELDWADGTYSFRLGWGELAELQEKTDAGPYVVLGRLHNGTWRVEDISNTIRLGLIGAGTIPVEALRKVRTWVEARPPMESVPFALAVLSAGLLGAPDERLGEGGASKRKRARGSKISRTAKSGLAQSTEQAPSSASRRKRSTP